LVCFKCLFLLILGDSLLHKGSVCASAFVRDVLHFFYLVDQLLFGLVELILFPLGNIKLPLPVFLMVSQIFTNRQGF
jgi:hypothetical protein